MLHNSTNALTNVEFGNRLPKKSFALALAITARSFQPPIRLSRTTTSQCFRARNIGRHNKVSSRAVDLTFRIKKHTPSATKLRFYFLWHAKDEWLVFYFTERRNNMALLVFLIEGTTVEHSILVPVDYPGCLHRTFVRYSYDLTIAGNVLGQSTKPISNLLSKSQRAFVSA